MGIKKRIIKILYTLCLVISCIYITTILIIKNDVKADETGIETNVKYFEGYGANLNDNIIHEKTRLPSASNDSPSITVLVHGQGGNASAWSPNENYNLGYDSTSLVERLRKNSNNETIANVYWARMSRDIDDNNSSDDIRRSDELDDIFRYVSNNEQINPYEEGRFYLTKLNENYYNIDNTVDANNQSSQEFITKIEDLTKHIVILFESADSYSYHRDVYEELHTVIDRVSYDIFYLTGKIPKVNLISHSRGGITSMMYATGYRANDKIAKVEYSTNSNDGEPIGDGYYEKPYLYDEDSAIIHDHPFNVSELYSLGTPYWGTKWTKYFFNIAHAILSGAFNNCSAKNILDEDIQNELYECWEIAVDKNSELRLNAMCGTMDLSFLLGLLVEDYQSIVNMLVYEKNANLIDILNIIENILEMMNNNLIYIVAELTTVSGGNIFLPMLGLMLGIPIIKPFDNFKTTVEELIDEAIIFIDIALFDLEEFREDFEQQLFSQDDFGEELFTQLSYLISTFTFAFDQFRYVLGQFDGDTNIMHNLGDFFIDTNSQMAIEYSNCFNYEKKFYYTGLYYEQKPNLEVEMHYTSKSFQYDKVTNQPGIPHNLETRDLDMINYICNNITLGIPSNIYNYQIISTSTNGQVFNSAKILSINLPNYYYNANNNILRIFENIELGLEKGIDGYDVTHINSNAFNGLTNLQSINLPDTLISIGNSAFKNCTNLQIITIPNSVTDIEDNAFENCDALGEVYLSNSLEEISNSLFLIVMH